MFALVDCNNFYVSCERVFSPTLEGKPVAVLSNNDGCIISRSNELKTLGVKMGTPFYQLKPFIARYGIEVRSSNYELYGDMSRRVMEILTGFAPEVEQYSIDEAFLQLTLPDADAYPDFGRRIRQTVMRWVGLPVGVGIAPTRTLAKIANHVGKKSADGVCVLNGDPTSVLAALPVGEVWGVGHRLAEKLERIGIRTAGQLGVADEAMLRKKFNVCVARTALELRGIPAVESGDIEAPSQSISCSRSFSYPVTALHELAEAVASYTAQAAVKLRKEKLKASGANVYFQYYPDYGNVSREGGISGTTINFPLPTGSTAAMMNAINPVLPGLFINGRRYKKAGVVFWGLEGGAKIDQPGLFDAPETARDERLYDAIDRLNRQFGSRTVFHLGEGIDRPWSMKRDHLSPCCTTRWDQLLAVK